VGLWSAPGILEPILCCLSEKREDGILGSCEKDEAELMFWHEWICKVCSQVQKGTKQRTQGDPTAHHRCMHAIINDKKVHIKVFTFPSSSCFVALPEHNRLAQSILDTYPHSYFRSSG
jgi:hypothetical protein